MIKTTEQSYEMAYSSPHNIQETLTSPQNQVENPILIQSPKLKNSFKSQDSDESLPQIKKQRSKSMLFQIQMNKLIQDELQKNQDQQKNNQQETQLDEKKGRLNDMINRANQQRRLCRACLEIFFCFFFISCFLVFSEWLSRYNGSELIYNDQRIRMNVTNCRINIQDKNYLTIDESLLTQDQYQIIQNNFHRHRNTDDKHFDSSNPISSIISYYVPARLTFSGQSSEFEMEQRKVNDQNELKIDIQNILKPESCLVQIDVLEHSTLNNIQIDCQGTCFIYIDSFKMKTRNTKISGSYIETHIINFQSDYLQYQSFNGPFQADHIIVNKKANISIESGDLVYQSSKSFQLNWTNSNPSYCLASPFFFDSHIIGCKPISKSKIDEYLKDKEIKVKKQDKSKSQKKSSKNHDLQEYFNNTKNKDDQLNNLLDEDEHYVQHESSYFHLNGKIMKTVDDSLSQVKKISESKRESLFPPSCFGSVILCKTIECYDLRNNISLVYLKNQFGSIYANIIDSKDRIVNITQDKLFYNKEHYATDQLQWSIDSQKRMLKYLQQSKSKKGSDPTWVLRIGQKSTLSDVYQQWHVTYNPAYSYLRPWVLSTFTMTLLASSQFFLQASMNPGFCPFIPTLKLGDIYQTQLLIERTFAEAQGSLYTFTQQESQNIPSIEYNNDTTGIRQIRKSHSIREKWLQLKQVNESYYKIQEILLKDNQSAQLAYYISLILSLIIGIGLTYAIAYAFKKLLQEIQEQIDSIDQYNQIQENQKGQDLFQSTNITYSKTITDKFNMQELNKSNTKKLQLGATFHKKKSEKIIEKEDEAQDNQGAKDSKTINKKKKSSFKKLLINLVKNVPPVSAFLDYASIYVYKKIFTKSANLFYNNIFVTENNVQGKAKTDLEQRNSLKEQIQGSKLKILYEKFCYFNGLLEQKLNDPDNEILLKQKGYEIVDQPIHCYCRIIYKGEIPYIQHNKIEDSLQEFIVKCCQLTKFDSDYIEVDDFNSHYEYFCLKNHLDKQQIQESELKQKYGILTSFRAQQMVIRQQINKQTKKKEDAQPAQSDTDGLLTDENIDNKNKQTKNIGSAGVVYYINCETIENNFNIIIDKINDNQTIKEIDLNSFQLSIDQLIVPNGWRIKDAILVFFNMFYLFILPLPLLAVLLLDRTQYAPYSLIPENYLITKEDIKFDFWKLPSKLYHEESWIQIIYWNIIIYWVLAFINLIQYYLTMEFPLVKLFRKKLQQKKIEDDLKIATLLSFFQALLWLQIFSFILFFTTYMACCMVWMLLGAIVNASAFLPYATASATFITTIQSKVVEAMQAFEGGFEQVFLYVQEKAGVQFNQVMKKMGLKDKVETVINSDAFKSMAGQAMKFGLIDEDTSKHIDEKAVQLANEPQKAAKETGGVVEEIVNDPETFAKNKLKEIEKRAIENFQNKVKIQFTYSWQSICDMAICLIKQDKLNIKGNLKNLLNDLYNSELKEKFIYPHANEHPLSKSSMIEMFWQLSCEDNKQIPSKQFIDELLEPLADLMTELLKDYQQIEVKDIVFKKSFTMILNAQKCKYKKFIQDFEYFVQNTDQENIKKLKYFIHLFHMANYLFSEHSRSYLQAFHKARQFLIDVESYLVATSEQSSGSSGGSKKLKLLQCIDIIDFMLRSLQGYSKNVPAMQISNVVEKFFKIKNDDNQELSCEQYSPITLILCYMNNSLESIPINLLKNVNNNLKKQDEKANLIFSPVQSEYNQQINTLQSILDIQHALLNQFDDEVKRIAQLGKIEYRIKNTQLISFFQTILLFRNKVICTDEWIEELLKNQVFIKYADEIKLPANVLLGCLCLITKRWNLNYVTVFIRYALKLNKIDSQMELLFKNLIILFSTDQAQDLISSIKYLNLPDHYYYYLQLFRGLKKPKHFNFEVEIPLLQQCKYDILNNINIINPDPDDPAEMRKFQQQIIELIEDYEQQDSINLIQKQSSNEEGLQQQNGSNQITQNRIKKVLKIISKPMISIANEKFQDLIHILQQDSLNNHKFKFKNFEIYYLHIFVSICDIDCNGSTSESKLAQKELAKLLNINLDSFELLIQLFTNPKLDNVVKFTQQVKVFYKKNKNSNIVSEEFKQFAQQAILMVEQMNRMHFFKRKLNNSLFPLNEIPNELYQSLIIYSKYKFSQNAAQNILQYYEYLYVIRGQKQPDQDLDYYYIKSLNQLMNLIYSNVNQSEQQDQNYFYQVIQSTITANNKSTAISIFLDYLSKLDLQYSDTYLLFCCLYCFFKGQSREVLFDTPDNLKSQFKFQKITVVEYLQLKLDLPQEFFASLVLIYESSIEDFSQNAKRLILRLCQLKNIKNQKQMQILRTENSSKSDFTYASNQINIFNIDQNVDCKIIENLLNIDINSDINSLFFSKKLKIDSSYIEFFTLLRKLQLQSKNGQRETIYNFIKKSIDAQKVLGLLNIDIKEFIIILKILFNDFQIEEFEFILQNLKINIDPKILLNIVELVSPFKVKSKQKDFKEKLIKQFQKNQLINQELKLNRELISVVKCIRQCDIFNLERIIDNLIPYLSFPLCQGNFSCPRLEAADNYYGMLKGLLGFVSCPLKYPSIDTQSFLYGLKKQLFFKQQQYKRIKTLNQHQEKPKWEIEGKLSYEDQIQYLVLNLTKCLRLNPMWILLFLCDQDAWFYLNDHYEQSQNPFLNPVLAISLIAIFIQEVSVMKEQLTNFEFLNLSYQTIAAWKGNTNMQDITKHKLDEQDQSFCFFGGRILINFSQNIISSLQQKDMSKNFKQYYPLWRCAKKCNIDFNNQQVKMDNELNNLQKLYEEDKPLLDLNNNKLPYEQWLIQQIFINVSQLFPLSDDLQIQKNEGGFQFIDQLDQIFSQSNTIYYNLTILSELTQLRLNQFGMIAGGRYQSKDDEDFINRLTAQKIDYILTLTERYNFFFPQGDYFSKYRLIPLMSVAAGIPLEFDNILNTFPLQSLVNYEFILGLDKQGQRQDLLQNSKSQTQDNDDKIEQLRMQYKIDYITNKIFYKKNLHDLQQSGIIRNFKFNQEMLQQQQNQLLQRQEVIRKDNKLFNSILQTPISVFEPYQNHKNEKINFKWDDFFIDVDDSKFLTSNNNFSDHFKSSFSINQQNVINNQFSPKNNQQLLTINNKIYNIQVKQKLYDQIKVDPRSGLNLKETEIYFKQWSDLFKCTELKIILDILSRCFYSMSKSYFQENYSSINQLLQSFLQLNGAFFYSNYQNQPISQNIYMSPEDRLAKDISVIMQHSKSDCVVLTQLISNYLGFQFDISLISEKLFLKEKQIPQFSSFLQWTKSPIDQQHDSINNMIQNFDIEDIDEKRVLQDIVLLHQGDTRIIREFLDYSCYFEDNTQEAYDAKKQFSKLIDSFAIYQLHKEQYIDWQNYDFTQKLSSDYIDQLWRFSQIFTKQIYDKNFKFYSRNYNNNKIILKQIIDNQFDFIFANCDDDKKKENMNSERQGVGLKNITFINEKDQKQLEEKQNYLKAIAILHPQKLKNTEQMFNFNDRQNFINIVKEYTFTRLQQTENQEQDVIVQGIINLFFGFAYNDLSYVLQAFYLAENKKNSANNNFKIFQSFYVWNNLPFILNLNKISSNKKDSTLAKSFMYLPIQYMQLILKKNIGLKNMFSTLIEIVKNFDIKPIDLNIYQQIEHEKDLYILKNSQFHCNGWYSWTKDLIEYLNLFSSELFNSPQDKGLFQDMIYIIKFFIGNHLHDTYSLNKGSLASHNSVNSIQTNLIDYFFNYFQQSYYQIHLQQFSPQQQQQQQQKYLSLAQVIQPLIPMAIHPYTKIVEDVTNLLKGLMQQESTSQVFNNQKINIGQSEFHKAIVIALKAALLCFKDIEANDQSKKIFNCLIYIISGYKPDIDQKQQNITNQLIEQDKYQQKKNSLIEFLNLLMMNYQKLNTFMNPQDLLDIFDKIQILAQFSYKSISDKAYLESVLNLLGSIFGQQQAESQQKDQLQTEMSENNSYFNKLPKQKKQIVAIPQDHIKIIFELIQGQPDSLYNLLNVMMVEQNKIQLLRKEVKEIEKIGIFSKGGLTIQQLITKKKPGSTDDDMVLIMEKLKSGKADEKDLFKAVDAEGDKSGSISKQEFHLLSKRLGMNLTDHRINEIYASIKQQSKKNKKKKDLQSDQLDQEEFQKALKYLQNKESQMSLEALGISKDLLAIGIIYLCIILLLLFAFIFLGIEAFSIGGSFGSVINSLMAVGAGIGAKKHSGNKLDATRPDKVRESVDKNKNIIESNDL